MPLAAFVDSETRSLADVTKVGGYTYAHNKTTDALVWGYAFDDEPGRMWSPSWAWGNTLRSHADSPAPSDLLEHAANGGYLIAWNAFFDRWIWNAVMVPKYGWPKTQPEQWLCAQAQAEANNLPGQLGKAADCLGTPYQKDTQGKRLIRILSHGTREGWDSQRFETPDHMGHFRAYCLKDVLAMRDVWQVCRPLTQDEWAEYHASERINDRGVAVDTWFANAARQYAHAEFDDINGQLAELTEDPRLTLSAHLRKSKWLFEQLWPDEELQELVKRPERVEGKPRYSCDRATRDAVLEMISQPEHGELFHVEHSDRVIRFLELVEAGNSAAVRKFDAICNQAHMGRVHGSYSFNGAGQTGRFSSRGIQVHNIIRDPVEKGNPDRAIDAMEMVIGGATPDELRDEFGYPISRLLARLIRPTFIAPPGKMMVWADYDQIEGRVLPWLAATPQAEAKLDIYRSGQDVYTLTAADIAGCSPDAVTDIMRQSIGKVPELALGFGGSVGALSAMSRSYGVTLPEDQKKDIVYRWRNANPWAQIFWHELWEAAMSAYRNPGVWFAAGRVRYVFASTLMRGTLICELPDRRWLVYPQFKHEPVEYEDPDTGRTWTRWRTTFVKGFGGGSGRVELWYGVLAENITQATAASMLRLALTRLDDIVVLHTHDELVAEVIERLTKATEQRIADEMTRLPVWAEGLPLTVSVESGPYYTK